MALIHPQILFLLNFEDGVDLVFPDNESRQKLIVLSPTKTVGTNKPENVQKDVSNCANKIRVTKTKRCQENRSLYNSKPYLYSKSAISTVIKYDRCMVRINGIDGRNYACIVIGCGVYCTQQLTITTHFGKCSFKDTIKMNEKMSNMEIAFIKLNQFHRGMIKNSSIGEKWALEDYTQLKSNASREYCLVWCCFMYILYVLYFGYDTDFIKIDEKIDDSFDKVFEERGGKDLIWCNKGWKIILNV